jgi:hypothetical protein
MKKRPHPRQMKIEVDTRLKSRCGSLGLKYPERVWILKFESGQKPDKVEEKAKKAILELLTEL